MTKRETFKKTLGDFGIAILAGVIVALAYYFFQNSNGFAPGGVGGLATITYQLLGHKVSWALLMVAFNIPIFVLVTIFIDRKLGVFLITYMLVQSFGTELFALLGWRPYCAANNPDDFEIIFACIATGIISGIGFSIMLRRFGASGGTYAISALIRRWNPGLNLPYLAFVLDGSVVFVAFFVYGMRITPVICTLLNLFIANVVVDYFLSGMRNGYKFEIITDTPDELARELIDELRHGVTEIRVLGKYSNTEKHMLMCIIRKRQLGRMMKIIGRYPGTFANFAKVNEVFGRFKK